MPHMNRIRLVNVAFNDAKSFFDDFRMTLAGKSTTYDLVNGGGKSVLLMMLLQTVIPNTSLREDKPLKNIFIGGRDRTSHVLAEWILDDGERYKYMLTGFCARRKRSQNEVKGPGFDGPDHEQDEDTVSGGIDYYNYAIFYDKPEEYDIYSLNLVREDESGKTYMGYDELRSELNRLRQRGCPVSIKDRKGEYMEYIGMHNLISTEWKIIRDMNSGENSIEKYFRENKTSRRLIENLLLRIIDDTGGVRRSGKLEEDHNIQLADTLLEIRENLARLMKDREHLEEYNQILRFYNRMLEICSRLEEDFKYREELKQQAVKARNLLTEMLTDMKDEKEKLEADLSEKMYNSRKTEQERMLLDIQLLEFDKSELGAECENIKEQQKKLEDERCVLDNKYKEAGAGKEYLQYKEEKLKCRQAQLALEAMSQSRDELDVAYIEAGSRYRAALEHLQRELEAGIETASRQKEGLTQERDSIEQKINEVYTLSGIAKSNEDNAFAAKVKLDKEIKPLTEYFNTLGRIDILLDLDLFLKDSYGKLEELRKKKHGMEASLLSIRQNIEGLREEITQNAHKIERLEWQKSDLTKFFRQYEEERLLLEKKSRLYDCQDFDQWKRRLTELLHLNREAYFRSRVELDALTRKLDVLTTHGFYIPNEEVLALSDRLKTKCTFVMTGIEWLNGMDEGDREELLERAPLLPYSVLTDHDAFQRLKSGKLDFGGFVSDYPVPVIDFDFIRGEESLQLKDVIFPEADRSLITSADALDEYMEDLNDKIQKIREHMISLEESASTYNDDMNALSAFEDRYAPETTAERKRHLAALDEEIAGLAKQGNSLKNQLNDLHNSEKDLSLRISDNMEETGILMELREKAARLLKLNLESAEREKALEEARKERAGFSNELMDLNRQKQSLWDQIDDNDRQIMNLRLQLGLCGEQLSRVKTFDLPVSYSAAEGKGLHPDDEPGTSFLELDNARSKFEALDEQMRGRNRQEEDLRNQIQARENMMLKCAGNMEEHYGFTVDMMEQRELSGEIIMQPDESFIKTIKKNISSLDREISARQKTLSDIQLKMSRLEGIIEEKKKELDDEFQIQAAKYEYRFEIEKEIEDAEQILALYRDEIRNLSEQIQSLDVRIINVRSELNRYQEFIQREDISFYTDERAREVQDYAEFSSSYYRHVNGFREWEQSWKRALKSIESESQDFYIKDPVVQLVSLDIPDNLRDCSLLIAQMAASIEMIEEQTNKIQEDINVLQSYQQEFIRRCIHRADHALDLLKKLPALSRIEVEGTRVNMIRMDFSDFDEREKEMRMENHIQSIIREISEENITDRSYIANRLSTRELLAQVTDMEKAAVRLYKVESIKEHSRYLKWEHAVGSEGQSNALYFIFAVCLISYIRMLSSVNVSVRTKKVIIADNPFGATSAVYLWDPMFRILKNNDVQLIAPGHNIPRELTSRFEVNYLLNQDILSDSRTRVVVKDVRTEEDLAQMNFEKLEQLSLI
ncbi:MAG TPA: hypothetical protein GXZ29_08665 [Clostridiales bacterium]|nr:hypothetical protein [Clostridiales bacterium]